MKRIISVDAEGRVESVETEDARATRERLRWLAWLLDSSIRVPGTRLTVGLDAIVGVVPFIGDLVGVVLASFILSEAARLGAPRIVLWRMAANVAIDGIGGIVPLAGDLFDAAFKANVRNVRLLEAWIDRPKKAERASRLFALGLGLGLAGLLALLGGLSYLFIRWVMGLF